MYPEIDENDEYMDAKYGSIFDKLDGSNNK
jgi:hypothetical protein